MPLPTPWVRLDDSMNPPLRPLAAPPTSPCVDQHDVARRVALLGDDRRPQPGVAAADDAQVAVSSRTSVGFDSGCRRSRASTGTARRRRSRRGAVGRMSPSAVWLLMVSLVAIVSPGRGRTVPMGRLAERRRHPIRWRHGTRDQRTTCGRGGSDIRTRARVGGRRSPPKGPTWRSVAATPTAWRPLRRRIGHGCVADSGRRVDA